MEKENIKFELIGGLVVIKCVLSDEECLFAVDTGAKITALNSRYQNEYEENKIDSNIGAAMHVSNMKDRIISSMIIGNQKYENLNTVVFDLSYVEQALVRKLNREVKIHGVIGYNVLKDWNFMIDYQQSEIVFNYKIEKQNFYCYKFSLSEHLIIIEADINNQKRNFILDTGANANLLDENLFEQLNKDNYLVNADKQNYKVGNIDVNIVTGSLKNVKIINEIEYTDIPFIFQNMSPFNKNPSINIHGLVGYHILSNKKIILDYHNQLLYFSK